jgi:hypothetical protein
MMLLKSEPRRGVGALLSGQCHSYSSAPFRIGRSWLNSPGKFAAALREEDLKLRLSARCGAAEMKRINDLWNSLAFGHRGHPTM